MKDIYYLAEALREHSVGDVATGVELNGCYCDDQYGRFMPVVEGEKEKVLSALSEFYRQHIEWLEVPDIEPEFIGDYPTSLPSDPVSVRCDTPEWSDPVWRYGWPTDKRPEFSKVTGSRETIASTSQLGTTEKNTLLTIIAALCDYSDIKIDDRGAASQIAKLTEEIGATVSDDTVRRWLKAIPDATATRMK